MALLTLLLQAFGYYKDGNFAYVTRLLLPSCYIYLLSVYIGFIVESWATVATAEDIWVLYTKMEAQCMLYRVIEFTVAVLDMPFRHI